MLVSELAIFMLMIFDMSLFLCIKRTLQETVSVWVYVDIGIIIFGLCLFLYMYFREDRLAKQHLEVIVIVGRYVI